jgi:hypothetical protein
LPAEGEYLRPEDFFELDLRELDFLAAEPRVLFFALLLRVERLELPLRDLLLRDDREREDVPLELLLDFFLAAFFVAITILLGGQMACGLGQVAYGNARKVALRVDKRSHFSSHDSANRGSAHERVGNEPCRNACECAGYGKFENRRRGKWMKEKADANEDRRMNNVDGVGTTIKPGPEG